MQRHGAGRKRLAFGERLVGAIKPNERDAAPAAGRAQGADLPSAGRNRRAGRRRRAVITHRYGARARSAAMLHAGDNFLADKATFLEIDAVKLIHVGLVRKSVTVSEIDAAMRHP